MIITFVKTAAALYSFLSPRYLPISTATPIVSIMDIPKTTVISGIIILTAARATLLTYLLTKYPSTSETELMAISPIIFGKVNLK